MRTLDLFIFLRFLTYFLASLAVLVVLFVTVDFMSNLNRFGASVLISYYIYYVPFIAYNMIPVSALLALVTLVSSLVRTSELVALHSLGYGMFSIIRWILLFLVLLSFFLIWVGDVVIPPAMEKRNYIYYIEMRKSPGRYAKTKTKNIWYRTKGALINFENVLDENNVQGVRIYFVGENWTMLRLIEAKGLTFKGPLWQLKGVKDSQLITDQQSFQLTQHEELEIPSLTELESMKMSGNATEYLSSRDLRNLIQKNEEILLDTSQLKVTLFSKYSFALSVLILPLLGLCTVSVNRRSGNMFLSGAIAVLIVFVYWMFYNSFLSFGKAGAMNPLFAVIIIPLVAILGISFAIRRVLN